MRQLILILILANLLSYSIILAWLFEDRLVAFLNVGQGSAVLIRNKNNTYLYDTGRSPYLLFKDLDKLLPFYQKKIDILFISHFDKDHYGSVFELLERYQVRLIVFSTELDSASDAEKIKRAIKKANIPTILLVRGNSVRDDYFKFIILHPYRKFKKDNDNSLVIKLMGSNDYLLTGDIERAGINDLIKCCWPYLGADYFLVPHHGSRFSIDESFYKYINPKISIIQVGSNYYGHPHQETILSLSKHSKIIWRTDLNGSLIVKE
ncbi:MAG: MBL fold metallo-hydrolase [Patescibacteria group bacterium]|nr:MBL fold metallo-hydrolase [Patescibacteria group bacterium]